MEPKPTNYHVAIVGGGIAGLYAAYRLREVWQSPDDEVRQQLRERLGVELSDKTLRVAILEENPLELGGRLRSVELPFPHGSVIAEVGAMRFTTRQRLLRNLLHDLQIQTIPFEAERFDKSYFLRGKHFSDADLTDSSPYDVQNTSERPEKGKGPGELVRLVLDTALKELSLGKNATIETLVVLEKLRDKMSREKLTHDEWKTIQDKGLLIGKVSLRHIGMWNLIHHYLSPEAAKFVEDGFGYESVIGNWNLSDALPWFIDDFSPGQSYEAVEKGFGHLVKCLRDILSPEDQQPVGSGANPTFECDILFNRRVRTLAPTTSSTGYKLSATKTATPYAHSNDDKATFTDQDDHMKWCEVHANTVILAIPKRPLEKLTVKDLLKDQQSKRKWEAHLEKVRAHRLAKLIQAYRTAWWRTPDAPKGAGARIITDLPLRQLYYWDREWLAKRGRYRFFDKDGKVVTDTERQPDIEGIVVAYLDGHYTSYWRFITAVQRLHAKASVHRDDEVGTASEEEVKADLAEQEKRKSFGERIWGWSDPPEVSPRRWSDPKEKISKLHGIPIENWTDEIRARYLYFRKHGLFERASTKMSRILRDLHASLKSRKEITVQDPVVGAYTFWDDFGDDPIPEAGWHTWEPGAESQKAMEYMAQPFGPEHRVFVCGEAYSSEQGWIEGALKSVERVMDKLGVPLADDIFEHVGILKIPETGSGSGDS